MHSTRIPKNYTSGTHGVILLLKLSKNYMTEQICIDNTVSWKKGDLLIIQRMFAENRKDCRKRSSYVLLSVLLIHIKCTYIIYDTTNHSYQLPRFTHYLRISTFI